MNKLILTFTLIVFGIMVSCAQGTAEKTTQSTSSAKLAATAPKLDPNSKAFKAAKSQEEKNKPKLQTTRTTLKTMPVTPNKDQQPATTTPIAQPK